MPGDTKKEGRIKGFALLEFKTHLDATAALEQLRKSDVVFGLDSSANVAFAQTPIHPNQEVLSQVRELLACVFTVSEDSFSCCRTFHLYLLNRSLHFLFHFYRGLVVI